MKNSSTWGELDRAEQKAMARLYGGGSLLRLDSEVVVPLARRGLINRDGMTAAGEALCTSELIAFRRRAYRY
jgi:hypothetical protein